MAANKPSTKAKKSTSLITAIKFILAAQKEVDKPSAFHCQLGNNFITASDGIVTAAHPIEEIIEAKPHTKKFLSALQNCGTTLSITQQKNHISVRSGRFFAHIPCHPDELLGCMPDDGQVPITEVIKEGFKAIGFLALENGKTDAECSLLLQANSMITCNSVIAIEYWHGLDLPTLVLPKVLVSAVASSEYKLTHMGFTQNSVTFWFENGAWLKSQLYGSTYPELNAVFNMPEGVDLHQVPKKLYVALQAVEDFADEGKENGIVYLDEEGIRSHPTSGEGAFYEIKGLGHIALNIRQLKHIRTVCDDIAFGNTVAWFFGESLRGAIRGCVDPRDAKG